LEALAGGLFIAWINESPIYSDPARIGFCLVIFSAAGAFIARRKPWLIALLVSIWVTLLPMAGFGERMYWYAILPALFGAYITYLAVEKPDLI
jgi:hypothetical protein